MKPNFLNVRWSIVLAMIAVIGIFTGCQSQRPPTYPVSGEVRFTDGSPVTLGFVEFVPDAAGPSARGKLDAQGRFTLGTFTQTDGARAGTYKVLLVQPVAFSERVMPAGREHQQHVAQLLVDPKLSQIETTDLTADVAATKKNELRLIVSPKS